MPILNIDSTKFYYELHGKGEPLVLIAGLKSDHNGWLPILESLSEKYQVLIFDNRAVGQTIDSGSSFDIEVMAEDTMNIVRALGIVKPHIVGHSLGGAVAQVIANKYPNDISSVALCNTFIRFNDVGREIFSNVLKLYKDNASQADIMEYIVPHVFSKAFVNPALIDIVRSSSNDNPYPQSYADYSRQLTALYSFDSREWIKKINVPTLVLGSDEDKVATLAEAREISKNIVDSKLAIMTSGHGSQVEQPASFVNHLIGFYTALKNIDCVVENNAYVSTSLRG